MNNPFFVSINLVVMNGEKFIRFSLDSIKKQTYPSQFIEVNILDNGSTDATKNILKKEFPEFNLIENNANIGFWAGQEKLLNQSKGEIIIAMTDVILDDNFIKNAALVLKKDPHIGAIQAKIYQMKLYPPKFSDEKIRRASDQPSPIFTDVIDTAGFFIFKSRRIVNLGHGDKDTGQFSNQKEIFAVEGAVPVFKKTALEDCKIEGKIIDPDFRTGSLGYGDDLDLAWRMRLFGWKEILAPDVIAYHDRSTTKNIKKHWLDYFSRVHQRSQISLQKRRLDWKNVRFTIIKNDYIINILKDLPQIIIREAMVLIYSLLFEPKILLEIPIFLKLIPKMIRKRKTIMKRAKISPKEMRKWFIPHLN